MLHNKKASTKSIGSEKMIVFHPLWETMKRKGVSTYALRERHNLENRTIRRLRANQNVTTETLNRLCVILDCSLSEIAEYVSTQDEE